jgi:2-aminoethylphosphonate-pyruvate transaminase
MKALGFSTLLNKNGAGAEGYIITSFRFPDHPNFNFEDFYKRLSLLGKTHFFYEKKTKF